MNSLFDILPVLPLFCEPESNFTVPTIFFFFHVSLFLTFVMHTFYGEGRNESQQSSSRMIQCNSI